MALVGTDVNLRGSLGFKGERGFSAYEVAVQNGFIGSEQDWLATLGTSSHFNEESLIHISTTGQTSFDLPSNYTSNSFIDVYVNGLRLNSNEYTINISTKKINLVGVTLTAGQTVEIVVLTMSTNSLPIVETINSTSTNTTAAGAKAVYDLSQEVKQTLENSITNKVNTINDSIEQLSNNIDYEKFNKSNIETLTGSVQNIASGATVTTDIAYPSGFTKSNTLIVSKMVSSNNNYYDIADLEMTTSGFPSISMVALTDTVIRVWLKNTSNTASRAGHYKITIMRND